MQNTPTVSSGLLSATTQVYTGATFLTGVQVITDGTNAATVKVYDGTSAVDKLVAQFQVVGTDLNGGRSFQHLYMSKGIYVAISGTGAQAIIDYVDKAVL